MRYRSTDNAARLKMSTPAITDVVNPRSTHLVPPSCQSWKLALSRVLDKVRRAARSAQLRLSNRTELGLERRRGLRISTSHMRR